MVQLFLRFQPGVANILQSIINIPAPHPDFIGCCMLLIIQPTAEFYYLPLNHHFLFCYREGKEITAAEMGIDILQLRDFAEQNLPENYQGYLVQREDPFAALIFAFPVAEEEMVIQGFPTYFEYLLPPENVRSECLKKDVPAQEA